MTSRQLTIFKLVCMVMLSPLFLKWLVMSFLILSDCGPEMFLNTASPSSLYRPMHSFPWVLPKPLI